MHKLNGRVLAPKIIPGALVHVPGDAAFTALVGPGTGDQLILYNAPITAGRAVTLPTTGAQKGQVVKLARTAAATGAFNVTFAGKNIAVSEWAEAVFDGSAWVHTKFGAGLV